MHLDEHGPALQGIFHRVNADVVELAGSKVTQGHGGGGVRQGQLGAAAFYGRGVDHAVPCATHTHTHTGTRGVREERHKQSAKVIRRFRTRPWDLLTCDWCKGLGPADHDGGLFHLIHRVLGWSIGSYERGGEERRGEERRGEAGRGEVEFTQSNMYTLWILHCPGIV